MPLVGVIQIPASALKAALPAGAIIELALEVDRGGALPARAVVPAQDLIFDDVEQDEVEQLVAPATSQWGCYEGMNMLCNSYDREVSSLGVRG